MKSKRKRPRLVGTRREDRGCHRREYSAGGGEQGSEERSMGEIKTNDRLGERPRSVVKEDRERIVRSKHLTRAIDHLVDPDSPPLRAAEHSIRGGSREFSTWKLIMLPWYHPFK